MQRKQHPLPRWQLKKHNDEDFERFGNSSNEGQAIVKRKDSPQCGFMKR